MGNAASSTGRSGTLFAGVLLLVSSAFAGIITGFFNSIGQRAYDRWVDGCVKGENLPVCETVLVWEGLLPKPIAVPAPAPGAVPAPAAPGAASAPGTAPTPTTVPSVSAVPGSFPQGSERRLTEQDIGEKSCPTLRIVRNEIYARHGHAFHTPEMQKYFSSQSWYVDKNLNADSLLTPVEQQNVKFIHEVEMRRGCTP